jgi:PERQ amino acid-rich with GYF domain-containing protein
LIWLLSNGHIKIQLVKFKVFISFYVLSIARNDIRNLGPFRADLMQKWYNAGYFSSDLPMKRVVYDTHWTTVEELIQKANGENIFLSPLVASIPINHGNGSPSQTYPLPDGASSEPFQPAPIRTLRTSTLESYLNGGSIASDSPSSSVGASHFANPSPDPGAFGGRDIKPYYGGDVAGRLNNFGVQDLSPYPDRRPLGHEYPNNAMNVPPQGPSFGNFVSDRDPIYNAYSYNQQPIAHDPWMMPSTMFAGGRELTGIYVQFLCHR